MRTQPVVPLALSLFCAALPILAHHSFAAEYDSTRQINITGTVTRVEWMNPHACFYVDVKDGDSVTNWNFELGPGQHSRQGGLEERLA
jgi:hypothetical protein